MKKLACFLATTAIAGVLLPATSASAQDLVCVPITVDGQPIACVDVQPVDDAVATVDDAVATVNGVLAPVVDPVFAQYQQALADEPCLQGANTAAATMQDGNLLKVEMVSAHPSDSGFPCTGTETYIPAATTVPGPTVHLHVPQICVTTTGTCVGPVDKDVAVPAVPGPISVCQRHVEWYHSYSDGSWQRFNEGPATCTSVSLPLG